MTRRILTMNEKDTLATAVALADLHRVIVLGKPDAGGLQEWSASRDRATRELLEGMGYAFTRGPHGGSPALWDTHRYRLRHRRSVRLARAEFVGHLAGRRDRLPASWATEVVLDDLETFSQTVLLVAHLTAEVQTGAGGYRTDLAHRLRVLRHKREKRRLGRRARWHRRHDRWASVVADTNFDRMQLGGFVGCWEGVKGATLGWRAVDIVYADRPAVAVRTVSTNSDHDAVVASYP